jgi:hypothetical protein
MASYRLPRGDRGDAGHALAFRDALAAFRRGEPAQAAAQTAQGGACHCPLPINIDVQGKALFECSILIGVPRVIESILALCEAAEPIDRPREEDGGFRSPYKLDNANAERGRAGLARVYKANLGAQSPWKLVR